MIIKKKMKTKIDYQIRTFAICVSMITLFTLIFVVPRINTVANENVVMNEELNEIESVNIKLIEEITVKTAQIKNND